MNWAGARERLGAELIGARESISHRWRLLLAEAGSVACSIEGLAGELILQAGAALADGHGPEVPWARCGGVLRIDARQGERALLAELTALWTAMEHELERLCLCDEEQNVALEIMGRQLEATLRGAAAEVASVLRGEELARAFAGGSLTPARLAFERPMAIACLVERAPCLPSRMWSISSRTNSPAWVDGLLPSRASRRARCSVSLSGIRPLGMRSALRQTVRPLSNANNKATTRTTPSPPAGK